MAAIIHPLLTLLASLTRQELAQQVTYLKAENRILRSKLPDRMTLSNQERRTLVRHGKKLGARIKELISIVSYSTFRKWVRSMEDGVPTRPKSKTGKSGRPRIEEDISATIIRIRKETNWGYTKIVQAMRRLGHKISRQTVKNVLVQAGLGPQPHDHPDTWSDFLKRHAATMWQCDFACKRKWTIKGMVDLYFLVFIHIESRRIWISPCTANPTGDWTTQQARNFQMHLVEEKLPCTILMRDNDRKYVDDFDKVFTASKCVIHRNVPMTPAEKLLRGFCTARSKERLVPASPRLLDELREYWKLDKPRNYLFSGKTPDTPLSSATVQKACKLGLAKAQINQPVRTLCGTRSPRACSKPESTC